MELSESPSQNKQAAFEQTGNPAGSLLWGVQMDG